MDPARVKASPDVYLQARRFFELTTSFYYLIHNFKKAEEHFAVLSFFYENCRQLLPPSDLEAKVVTLRLVQLYAQGETAEFYSLSAAVPAGLRTNADFQHLDEFVYFTEIGSFRSALNSIAKISLIHKALLSQMEDSMRQE